MVAEELEVHEAVAAAIAETGVTFCTDHVVTATIPLNENLQKFYIIMINQSFLVG